MKREKSMWRITRTANSSRSNPRENVMGPVPSKPPRPPRRRRVPRVCASAIGYYGDRGADVLTEESPPGAGFLPDVCREWEAATEIAARKGIRVVALRGGGVLPPGGGAPPRILPPFRAGLGGVIGN